MDLARAADIANLLGRLENGDCRYFLSVTTHLPTLAVDGPAPIRYIKINCNVYLCILPPKMRRRSRSLESRWTKFGMPQSPFSLMPGGVNLTVFDEFSVNKYAIALHREARRRNGSLQRRPYQPREECAEGIGGAICRIYTQPTSYAGLNVAQLSNIAAYRCSPRERKLCQTRYPRTRCPPSKRRCTAPSDQTEFLGALGIHLHEPRNLPLTLGRI